MKKLFEKNTAQTPASPIGVPAPSTSLPAVQNPTPSSPATNQPSSPITNHPPLLTSPIDAVNCPVRQVLDRIGDKWSTLVILLLGDRGKLRFNQLSNAIGDISQKMLTVTLRSLEADGLVTRKMYPEIPPRVEYELTPLAESLLPLIIEMVKWADAHIEEIHANRRRHSAPSQT